MDSPAPVFSRPSSFSALLGRVLTDEERSRDLARIKMIATTLLVFSVAVAFWREARRYRDPPEVSTGVFATGRVN